MFALLRRVGGVVGWAGGGLLGRGARSWLVTVVAVGLAAGAVVGFSSGLARGDDPAPTDVVGGVLDARGGNLDAGGADGSVEQPGQELPDMRTASTKTFVANNGDLKTELFAAPVNY